MRQVKVSLVMIITLLLSSNKLSAYDFEFNGIYYNILSVEEATCEVTYCYGPASDGFMPTYTGYIEIPEIVNKAWWSSDEYTVVSIGDYAFEQCMLDHISLPETITRIGNSAFRGCEGLSFLSLPYNVEFVGDNAFYSSDFCNSLVIPSCCKYIGASAFFATKITSLIFEQELSLDLGNLCEIGEMAFGACEWLEYVDLKGAFYHIGTNPFMRCVNLAKIEGRGGYTGDGRSQGNILIDGCLYCFTEENNVRYLKLLCCPAGKETYTSPNSYTGIEKIQHVMVAVGDYAFMGCEKITFLDIPNTTTKIGEYALFLPNNFNDYTYRKVIIPESVEEIGDYAIGWCGFNWDIYIYSSKITRFIPTIGVYENKHGDIHILRGTKRTFIESNSEIERQFNIIDDIGVMNTNLTVSSVGYATLYLDYAATIPEGVGVYIATSVEGDRLMMTQVTGVLPAETGVIVRAKAGTYTFAESEDTPANVDGNLLSGTATDTYITAESGYRYYVLAQKEGMVGMYRPKLNADGKFLNNANKAYLRLESDDLGIFDDETNTEEEGGQLSNRLRFDFGGTTEIEKTIDPGQQTTVIHDLTGRRVEKPTKPGIYIVNGQKVVF